MTLTPKDLSEAKAALLAKYLRGEMPQLLSREGEGSRSRVVRLQEGNDKQPLFFLHGDLRDGGIYAIKLARALDPDRPFYAIHPTGTDGKPVPHTFEAIVADHLEALQAVQPEGPYLLGGFCNGAAFAFEVARQLQAQGQRVDALVMIEPGSAHSEVRVATILIGLWGKLVRLSPEQQIRLFLDLRTRYLERSRRLLSPGRKATIARIDAVIKGRLERFGHRFLPASRRIQFPSLVPKDYVADARSRSAFELEYRYTWASNGYTPRRYRGRAALFWAREEQGDSVVDPALGWREIIEDVDVYATPGDHFTAITTHVEALAERMGAWLDAGERSRTVRSATNDA